MPLMTLPVSDVRVETRRNRIVRLALGRHHPFPYRAGQHVLLGDHGQADRRPYSIANAPVHAARDGALEFLIQVVEDESPGPHLRRLERGTRVDVEGPAGNFTLPSDSDAHTARYLFVGGGTGIAPLRAMAWEVLETQPGARVSLVQSARTPEELSYTAELRALATAGRLSLLETVTRAAADGGWTGTRGRIDAGTLAPLFSPGALCFVCGPDSLVEDVPLVLASLGAKDVKTEHWAG
ncbi:MAG: FAD-dependent oxidoreductase [Acidobacteria bacterium]|nr:MAG: FAD-dependent oxidoreductase [Acidobacteriota bacterium]